MKKGRIDDVLILHIRLCLPSTRWELFSLQGNFSNIFYFWRNIMLLRFLWAVSVFLLKLVWITFKFIAGIQTKPLKRDQDILNQYLIRLSSEDPLFYVKKQKLKKSGYKWHCHQKAWGLPQIKLRKNQQANETALKKLGYRFDQKSGSWIFPYQ
jgi:hypothetical protein